MLLSDIVILAIITYGGYKGYQQGLIEQFVIPLFIYLTLYKKGIIFNYVIVILQKSVFLMNIIQNRKYILIIISFTISLLLISIPIICIKKIINIIFNNLLIKPIDNIIGFILGIIKYCVYISIIFFFIRKINKIIQIFPNNFLHNSFEEIFKIFLEREFIIYKKIKNYFIDY